MKLAHNETELIGKWELKDGRVQSDETGTRIEQLVAHLLERVAWTADGWEILYRDPSDGRYWELTYPQSELQGGGPQTLHFLEPSVAAKKYGLHV